MGRPRAFDEDVVLAAAHRLFVGRGYEATSVDDLVQGTGVHRGSLYKAFGSKRGLFVAVLQGVVRGQLPDGRDEVTNEVADEVLDLLLVAALEVAPGDAEVAGLVREARDRLARRSSVPGPDAVATVLGRRLLRRADPIGAAAPVDLERRS